MGDVAIRKDDLIDWIVCEQSRKFLFRIDGNPLGIMGSGKLWGIDSIGNVRDLCGGESNDTVGGAASEKGIKIMEIPTPCAKDNDLDGLL
jgi:hypothetical protein